MVTYRRRRRKICGSAMDFCPNFPKLARNVFVRHLPTNFLPHRSWRTLLVWPPEKRAFMCFCTNFGRHFLKWNNIGHHFAHILMDSAQHFRDFSRISTNQHLWGCACTPAPPASCTTMVTATFVESSVANSPLALRGMCDYHEWDVCQE